MRRTRSRRRAAWEDFADKGGGWPRLVSGPAMFQAVAGANIPVAGFIEAMGAHTLLPATWAAASPSGPVTRDAYERISALILQGLSAAMPLDGVYLDLHGAMVAEHLDDGEGELLRRVRERVGPDVPVVASLDLHANMTREMLRHADALVCYRTYPHIDMAETGQRAAALLATLHGAPRACSALRQLPYLIPLCWQSTDIEPRAACTSAWRRSRRSGASLSFATGFPAADFPECLPAVWAHAATQAQADAAASEMERAVLAAECAFGGTLHDADEAVQTAMRMARDASRPVVIADAQDNPGAGGSSDTTGVLRALIRHGARDAAIGLIVDPAAALAAHHAGAGNTVRIALVDTRVFPTMRRWRPNSWSKNIRRPLRHAWRVLPRLPYGPGAQRLPEPGRRAHRGGLQQGADGRPGDVPLCRRGSRARRDPGGEKFGALPRRLHVHRPCHPGLRGAWIHADGRGKTTMDTAASRHQNGTLRAGVFQPARQCLTLSRRHAGDAPTT